MRVAELRKGKERGYYAGLVTGAFDFRQEYSVCGQSTAKGLLLQRRKRGAGMEVGRTETVRLNAISNMVPSPKELRDISREIASLQKMVPDTVSVCTR